MINYEDFKKIDLVVAKIVEAENVENSNKLIKLQVDIGSEHRQIIAGIKSNYQPEDLVGKEIIVLINLEPRVIFGLESQGMLLAADSDKPVILTPLNEVPPGTKIQ
jgi:methionine--tRNA ligase beta chain